MTAASSSLRFPISIRSVDDVLALVLFIAEGPDCTFHLDNKYFFVLKITLPAVVSGMNIKSDRLKDVLHDSCFIVAQISNHNLVRFRVVREDSISRSTLYF